jgi:hypothetical protein
VINAAVEEAETAEGSALAIDGSRLELGSGRYAVVGRFDADDDVDEYLLDLTGHAGRQFDFLLSGFDTPESTDATLELIAPDGATVLATGTSAPLGPPADGYASAILGFPLPSDGIYTLRAGTATAGDYTLLALGGAVFDSEPNLTAGQPQRSLDATGHALGFLARDPVPDVLYYSFDEAGGRVTTNAAAPGSGSLQAAVVGHTLAGSGQFGAALTGADVEQGYIDTGWTTDLGYDSWSIGLWLDRTTVPMSSSWKYLFGDPSLSFAAYYDGSGNEGDVRLSRFG